MAVLSPALDEAVSELRYGTIALTAWIGVDYLTATATASWDTFPRHTPDDVESGIGVVHNALLLDGPERTVARSPFHPAHQALLHGVQLDRAGTLGTDAARPSLPVPKRQSIRLTPQPGSALDDRRAGPGSGQTHRQRDRAGSAHGPAHGVPSCLSGRALTSSRPRVVQKLLTVWTFRRGWSHGHVTRRRELARRPDFRRSVCAHRPRDRSHPGSTGWRQPE